MAATILATMRVGEEPGALSGWQALVLGIVQGLTELLPISSSGHLILVPWLADWTYLETHDDFNQTFDVALHFGTLVAVVAYFRADLARLLAAWLRSIRRRRVETHGRAPRLGRRDRDRAGRGGRRRRREPDRRQARRAVADRDLPGVLRHRPLDRRSQPAGAGARRRSLRAGARAGLRAVACAHAGCLAFRDHDLSRPLPEARPGRGRAALVPAPRADRARRGPVQGRDGRAVRRPAVGLGWPLPGRHAGSRRGRAHRDRPPARSPTGRRSGAT